MPAGGLLIPALPPVDEPEVGQRAGFADLVTGPAEEGKCLLVVLGGLLVAALPHVNDAKIGRGVGFTGGVTRVGAGLLIPVTGLDGHSEPGGVLGACLLALSRGVQRLADAVECLSLAVTVAGLAEHGQSLPQIIGRLLVEALPQTNEAEVGQCVALADAVARVTECG